MMMSRRPVFALALVALFVCGSTLAAEQRGRGRGGQEIRLGPAAQSQDELEAFQAVRQAEGTLAKLNQSETFLTTFPESELKHLVYQTRLQTFLQTGNNQAAIQAAEAGLEAEQAFYAAKKAQIAERFAEKPDEAPDLSGFELDYQNSLAFYYQSLMDANNKLNIIDKALEYGDLATEAENSAWEMYSATADKSTPEYQEAAQRHTNAQMYFVQTMMGAAQAGNDAARTIEYAEKALEMDPENLLTLITISSVMAERPPQNEDERKEQMRVAERHARKAVDKVEALLSSPASMQMDPRQKADLQAAVHSTLGLIYLNQQDYGDAQDSYEAAIEAVSNDPIAYFRLGLAYAQDDKADEAMENLAKSVYLKGVTEDQARDVLKQIWDALKKPEAEMEQYIQEQGQSIGSR